MDTLSGEGVGYHSLVSDQFVSYIGGQAGTGKTLLIRAFLFGLAILDRLDEVLLTAPVQLNRGFSYSWLHYPCCSRGEFL
jgi:hypothetical protein